MSPTDKKKKGTSMSPSEKKNKNSITGSKRKREIDPRVLVINLEEETPDEWKPRNELESHLLHQVRAKNPWFKQREILCRIRQMKHDIPLTAEAVIEELKKYRQLIEEARQMDQARLLSEKEHDEEDAKRRKTKEEEILLASFDEWKSTFSPASRILESTSSILRSWVKKSPELRFQVLRLLRLEQKAYRWYAGLCRAHFTNVVCPAIQTSHDKKETKNAALCCITKEADVVELAMFRLSEQSGGVPRLFREAHDKYAQTDANKDQVVVLRTTSPSKSLEKKTVGDASVRPILEIL